MSTLTVNGQAQSFDGDPSMPLLWYLRDDSALTGTKFGCGVAACGACTIHLDGEAGRSCNTTVSDANGKSITTIEGLDPEGNHPLQKAWRALNVPQCGFCQAGQIMQAAALLKQTPHPTDFDTTARCTATFAAAGPISAFAPPSSKLRERDMTKHILELAPSGIENVSRRGVLKGILSTTGLVLAVSVLPHRPALGADAPKWGATACRTAR